jgi:hypothetical protein
MPQFKTDWPWEVFNKQVGYYEIVNLFIFILLRQVL